MNQFGEGVWTDYHFGTNLIAVESIRGIMDKNDSIKLVEYLVETFNIQETEINFQE